jgi:hypothetical protein
MLAFAGTLMWGGTAASSLPAGTVAVTRAAHGPGRQFSDAIVVRPAKGPGGIRATGRVRYSCGRHFYVVFLDVNGRNTHLGRFPVGRFHLVGNLPVSAALGIGQVATEILVPNPPHRCSGMVTASAPFNVTTGPGIFGFTPRQGPVGTVVAISGSGLADATVVRFNGISAQFSVESDGKILATVPAGAASGPITIVTPAGRAVSGPGFKVT